MTVSPEPHGANGEPPILCLEQPHRNPTGYTTEQQEFLTQVAIASQEMRWVGPRPHPRACARPSHLGAVSRATRHGDCVL